LLKRVEPRESSGLTAEEIKREYGEVFLLDLAKELQETASPGEVIKPKEVELSVPPNVYPKNLKGGRWTSKFSHVRAKPLPNKLGEPPTPPGAERWPTKLLPWQEAQFVQWWREDYAENVLTALVEAHRPMVVHMAMKRVGTDRKLIIEYGMFGLRIAASPQWSSRKKKGALAGYDPEKGPFNTYARYFAERFMIAAAQAMGGIRTIKGKRCVVKADKRGYFSEPPSEDTITEFREWAATPIPDEIELERARLPEGGKSEIEKLFYEETRRTENGKPQQRSTPGRWRDGDPQYKYGKSDPHCFCKSFYVTRWFPSHCWFPPSTTRYTSSGYMAYWLEGFFHEGDTKLEKDQKRKTELSNIEIENRKQYFAKCGAILGSCDQVAADGTDGWKEGAKHDKDDDRGWKGDGYQEMDRRDSRTVVSLVCASNPYASAFSEGEGLPQLRQPDHTPIPKKRRNAPLVCPKPAASRYLMNGEGPPLTRGKIKNGKTV
jgi:hypothetical protein